MRGQLVQERPHRVDDAGVLAGEQLERDERRAAARRALVLEPPAQQLELLPVAELADRAVRRGALPEVRASRRRLQLVVPLRPELGELPLGAALRELVGLDGRLGERHRVVAMPDSCIDFFSRMAGAYAPTPASDRSAGPT